MAAIIQMLKSTEHAESVEANLQSSDCILYPMQYLYDPGILPSSAN